MGEVLIAGRLGAWLEERDASGGLDPNRVDAALGAQARLMAGRLVGTPSHGGVDIETTLDPRAQAFLYDHAPDPDTPWLPGVMAIEALAESAQLLAPDHQVAAVEDVRMLGAFKFFRMEPRTLHVAGTVRPVGDELHGSMVLRSVTQPLRPEMPAQVKEHFVGKVRLARSVREPVRISPEAVVLPESALTIRAASIYPPFFHGPAYRVVDGATVAGGRVVARMTAGLPPQSAPAGAATLMAPRLVELCFQAAALWSLQTAGAMAFPASLASLVVYRQEPQEPADRLWCTLETGDGSTFEGQVVDEEGNVYVALKGYRTIARPG